MPARLATWIFILPSLTVGAVVWWQFRGENQGQAAETMNATVPGPTSSILVGHWTLDGNDVVWGDTSTEIKDVSGYAKHGNFSNNLSAGSATAGRIGQGIVFNGTSDSVSLGSVYNGVKTVAFWVKPNSTTQSVIDLNATATMDINAGTVRGNNFSTPTVYVDGAATATFPDTNWHHVAITTATGINASAAYLGLISSTYFGGRLDDIRFYSTELSATQVADLYKSSGAKEYISSGADDMLTDGLVGYWTMDGDDIKWSDANEIKDVSTSANHGNAMGSLATTSTTRGKVGQGLSFDGAGDYVRVPYNATLNCPSVVSLVAWINARTFSAFGGIVGRFDNYNFQLIEDEPFDGLQFSLYASGNWRVAKTTNLHLQANQWYHVAVVFDETTDVVYFYVNGSLQSSPSMTYDMPNSSVYDLTMGSAADGDGDYLTGSIDDVRVYNRALSAPEIQTLYNIGK